MTSRVWVRLLLVLAAVPLVACGGGEPTTPEGAEGGATTAGGEAEPVEDHPMRTTTPVPVPQSAVAREELSEPLQSVWTQIEEIVSIRPPEGPEEASQEAVQAWAEGAFREWVATRTAATQEALTTSEDVPDEPVYERAVASALLGYALEDFVADVRGSPVPADIAEDEELRDIYIENLTSTLRPMAIQAMNAYAFCQRRIADLGDDSVWLEWRAYCVQRGREVIQTYEITPEELQGGEAPADEGEGADEAPAGGREGVDEENDVG